MEELQEENLNLEEIFKACGRPGNSRSLEFNVVSIFRSMGKGRGRK